MAYKENTGGDPFAVNITHSDRERSKLLREQNVLKQVNKHYIILFTEVMVDD